MVRELCDGPDAGRTFGVLGGNREGDQGGLGGSLGITAEIFEVRDSESGEGGPQEVGLKLKARGKQRFRLLSARRTLDGILMGDVILLQDKELGDPLWGFRLKSLDKTCLRIKTMEE